MSEKTNVNVRMDKEIKQGAEEVLKGLGMTMSQAINLMAYQIVRRRSFPIELELDADPFWSDCNQAILSRRIAKLEAGFGKIHELIEAEDE